MRAFACLCAIAVAGCAAVPAVPMSAAAQAREALAPGGRLRAGLHQGVGRELAAELAAQLRVPVDDVVFERDAELIEALRSGRIDVGLTRAAPEQADLVLVPAGKASAVVIHRERGRAAAFLREFADDARLRGH